MTETKHGGRIVDMRIVTEGMRSPREFLVVNRHGDTFGRHLKLYDLVDDGRLEAEQVEFIIELEPGEAVFFGDATHGLVRVS
jgi:hypothetical protein